MVQVNHVRVLKGKALGFVNGHQLNCAQVL
jgi:hypothetical protein